MKPVRDGFCKERQEKKLAAQKVDHKARKQQQSGGGNAEFNRAAAALHARLTGQKKTKRVGHIPLQEASFSLGAAEDVSETAQSAQLEHSADRLWRFDEDRSVGFTSVPEGGTEAEAEAEAEAPPPAVAHKGKSRRLVAAGNPFDLLQEDEEPVRAMPLQAASFLALSDDEDL